MMPRVKDGEIFTNHKIIGLVKFRLIFKGIING